MCYRATCVISPRFGVVSQTLSNTNPIKCVYLLRFLADHGNGILAVSCYPHSTNELVYNIPVLCIYSLDSMKNDFATELSIVVLFRLTVTLYSYQERFSSLEFSVAAENQ